MLMIIGRDFFGKKIKSGASYHFDSCGISRSFIPVNAVQ